MSNAQLPPRAQQTTVGELFREALRLDSAGRYGEAQKLCQQILKVRPDQEDAHHLLGVIAFHAGRNEDAIRHLKHTLRLRPDMSDAALNLFRVYRHKGRWREALAALEAAQAHGPGRSDIVVEMGLVQEKLDDDAAAMTCYRRALDMDPRAVLAHSNLGAVLTRRGEIAGAEEHLKAALALDPGLAAAHINLAMLHDVADRRGEVIATYDRLLRDQPAHVYGHFQRAMALLCQGQLAQGWEEYLWRFQRPETRTLHNAFPFPYWRGENLDGRKLLVWTEQGPGDEALLGSMIPDVLERGARLTLVCSPRLAPLFRRSFKTCAVIAMDRLPRTHDGDHLQDFQASFSHLGAVLRPALNAFPARPSYLAADPGESRKLRARYQAAKPGMKLVGIAWHSANAGAEHHKSVPLQSWAPILKIPGVTFVSLQYGDHGKDAKAAGTALGCDIVVDKSINPLKDIDGFAAQVAAMDHVVSVSNTTVHIAGALGVPTSTMIPSAYGRIWYWFLDRTDSPWYPAMRLFRQGHNHGWEATMAAVADDLTRRLGG